jgi:hypothetical protein
MRKYLPVVGIILVLTVSAIYGCNVPEYRCELCGQAFDTEEELDEHMNLIHREGPGEGARGESGPTCDICGEELESFDEFVAHMEKEHPDEWRAIKEGQE